MIYFVAALPSEARPLIHHYDLKPVPHSGPFKVYRRADRCLIVSGIGKIRSANAVAFLHSFSGHVQNQIWINIGIGGHSERAVGEGILAHKITDRASGESWYPPILFDLPCPTESVLTVDRAETKYPEPYVYEMEAAGFYDAALRFSTAELVQCYKIISDNRSSSPEHISAAWVERLIEQNLKVIDDLVRKIEKTASELPNVELPLHEFQSFLDRWHFTVTEQHQLRRLLLRLKTLEPRAGFWPELARLPKSKDVLDALENRINLSPVHL